MSSKSLFKCVETTEKDNKDGFSLCEIVTIGWLVIISMLSCDFTGLNGIKGMFLVIEFRL